MRQIDAPTLKSWIGDGQELAILDAREDGEFGRSHLFWAVPCALSRVEQRARALLPRRSVRICCVDGGEGGLAERLAVYLEGIGCTDVSVLAGGTPAWAAAGHVLFSGVNVPSKAFGEWVEHEYGTPSVDPAELRAMMEAGTDMVVLDSRPMEEFRRMSIPGAIDVPGGELVLRIGEIAPRPETTVVVNCAGRTRSIMGAESLRSAGVPNRVVALRNGTMGWELAGFECDRGRTESYPRGTPESLPAALARATAFAERWGVGTLAPADLPALLGDPGRTTYLLDVRDPEEYAAGHLPGSRSAPGGQLVQGTDNWVAVRGARLVLVDGAAFGPAPRDGVGAPSRDDVGAPSRDDVGAPSRDDVGAPSRDGVRARMTGAWLRQLGGWEVFVLEGGGPDVAAIALESGMPVPGWPEAAAIEVASIEAGELRRRQEAGGAGEPAVVQLSRSLDFREAHIPGALWGVRTRLDRLRASLAARRLVVVAAPEEELARMAVPELRRLAPGAELRVLAGGLGAWRAAGLPLHADRRNPQDADCIDVHLRPYDRNEGVEAAMREYLSWEIDLVHEVARDGDARFGLA